MKEPIFLVIDLFCGFGGTTRGYELAELDGCGIAKVFACVNHDPKAIKSHWLNHPDVKHFEEDIRTLDLTELISLTSQFRIKYPNAYVVLWASLECTNFSKAKGGQPRDADSRTLADHLDRYITALNPDYIKIENVVEFMSWGPLDNKGKPISRKNGEDWMRWRRHIDAFGYRDEWREMNSANFGAYTSRNRLFGVFARPELPIVWPEPTHAKAPSRMSIHGDLKKWMPVKDVLDFADEGESIFTREKPLVDATLERIYAGLVKFIAKGDTAFLSKYFSGAPSDKNISTDGPAGTIKTRDGQTLIQAAFLSKNYSGKPEGKNISVEGPAGTITTFGGSHALVQPEFLMHYYSNGGETSSLDDPCPTVTRRDGKALVSAEPFIMPTNYDNKPKSVDEPSPTVTASRRHHYLINPPWGIQMRDVENPSPVLIARQDKAPLYLVQVEGGPMSIAVYEGDSEIMIKIKKFMAVYGLVDIKMRMLRVPELLRIQGFPADYKMVGNQSDQKKFIGNSVVPHVVKAWAEAMGRRLLETNRKVA